MRLDQIERALAGAPSAAGYLAVDTERGRRELLLGPRTQLEGAVPMLDWRTAPLAEPFFRHAPGEAYELPTGAEGRVRERWLVVGRGGLDALIGDDRVVTRPDERAVVRPGPAPAGGAESEDAREGIARSRLVVLDPEQQAAVDLPADASLVLDGEAGVGKTLVALYRVAALARRAEARSRRFRALVLVPTEGLRRLVRVLADRLGIGKLEIALVDDWLFERAQRAFPGLPKRRSESPTAAVIALKRHPAVRAVLDDFAGWTPPRGVERDDKLPRSRLRLYHLFGDGARLARIVAASRGELPERAIAAVMQHTRRQFETTTERAHRHVDADRLVALDGRALDAGTPMQDAGTVDAEDVPVLFELMRRGALPRADLDRYDHIVVDEAQLRSPLELAAIGDALAPAGTITLAGDHRQATDESAWFAGWDAARAELGRPRWAQTTLAVTYRSVPAIGAFARAISDRTARVPPEPPPDPAVWATACPGPLAQAALACWHLDALIAREPWRQICVVARTPEHARRLHAELARGLEPVLVLDGDFRFEPGIVVTTGAAVSGLEFDCVVIPDLTPAFYPAGPELSRVLYVAATRARDWLWLLTPEAWSPLVSSNPVDGRAEIE
jgi:DNA helicase II / ATP-dependent DNA helicase PcrA